MTKEYFKCALPDKFTEREIEQFISIVLSEGEVPENTLRKNIPKAERVYCLWLDDVMSAVGALKRPQKSYVDGFEKKSGFKLDELSYPFELGYIVVCEAARGKKFSTKIAKALLADTSAVGVFATSFVENVPMHKTLEKFEFKPAGKPYEGGNSQRKIQLFLRPAVQV